MKLENEYLLSFYQELASVSHKENIKLVKHTVTGKLFVKKVLSVYDRAVFDFIRMNHPAGVPAIVELVEDDGVLIVIEEYIAGERLSEMPLPLGEAMVASIVLQLCEILKPFHGHVPPIVHRDIKPENLIISGDGFLKLLDFNAAKFVTEAKRDTILIGTAGYAAPEQYGFSASTPATDIYAIGVLLTELLTGGKDASILPGRWGEVARKCTEMNPEDRFHSVDVLESWIPSGDKQRFIEDTSWIPPGFRTKTPWKIIVAVLGYIGMIDIALTLQVKNVSAGVLWLNRICFGAAEFSVLFLVMNYRGIQGKLPLTKNENKWIHYIGIILWSVVAVLAMATVASLFA